MKFGTENLICYMLLQWLMQHELCAGTYCVISLNSVFCIVLPRFEVTLEGPKQITNELVTIEGRVDGTYMYVTHTRPHTHAHTHAHAHAHTHTHVLVAFRVM